MIVDEAAGSAEQDLADEDTPPPGRHYRRWVLTVVVVLALAAVVSVTASRRNTAQPAAAGIATTTRPVVRTDLSSTVQIAGALSYQGSYAITGAGGQSGGGQNQQAGQALAQAQAQMATAVAAVRGATETVSADAGAADQLRQALAEQTTADRHALDTDQNALAADTPRRDSACAADARSTGCQDATQAVQRDTQQVTADQSKIAQDGTAATQQRAQAMQTAAHDQQQLEAARGQQQAAQIQLTAAQAAADHTVAQAPVGTTLTALPRVGQVIDQGQAVYSLDGVTVPLLVGSQPAYRRFAEGMTAGADVAELANALIKLGDAPSDLPTDGTFTSATAAGIRRLQAALGQPQTGVIPVGGVVFLPTALRVTALGATVGAPVPASGPILSGTSTQQMVTATLPVAQAYLVHGGDKVNLTLPNGSTATGTVSTLGAVATAGSTGTGNNGTSGGTGAGAGGSPSNTTQNATVPVTITVDDPGVLTRLHLDEGPVTVNIVDQHVSGVLAVPVEALVGRSDGGYGVQVDRGGTVSAVRVTPGLFANGLVEVSSPALHEGDHVVVPVS